MNEFQILNAIANGSLRPEIGGGFPTKLSKLVQKMWDAEPGKRPTIEDVDYVLSATPSDSMFKYT